MTKKQLLASVTHDTKKVLSEYFAKLGRKGMRERWKGTTKEERRKATEAATKARLAKRKGKGGK